MKNSKGKPAKTLAIPPASVLAGWTMKNSAPEFPDANAQAYLKRTREAFVARETRMLGKLMASLDRG